MTVRDALVKLGYDFDNKVAPTLCGGGAWYHPDNPLTPDSDILESGLKVSEKLCTPGCGCWAVVVEVQRADDWGMGRPWCCFYFKESEAKQNPSEWSFETKWYNPGQIESME